MIERGGGGGGAHPTSMERQARVLPQLQNASAVKSNTSCSRGVVAGKLDDGSLRSCCVGARMMVTPALAASHAAVGRSVTHGGRGYASMTCLENLDPVNVSR